ncbi:TRAPP trafficking subunit Trs65-domain-containing protein [Lipomyces oligophaga]|uniref:TRAPP trafficking subunit Trs65-domain-containing protein n=1 Tax=Lipomyces oligophaga TaxID=45792 RepID=UPI0034CDE158
MAQPALPRSSADLFASGSLRILVPDLISKTQSASEVEDYTRIHPRNTLFYDEKLPIYISLTLDQDQGGSEFTPFTFSAYISRLSIAVDVSIASFTSARYSSLGLQFSGQQNTQQLESSGNLPVFSTVLDKSALVRVAYPPSSTSRVWTAFWSVDVVLKRPKGRLLSPRVIVACRASLHTKATDSSTISFFNSSTSSSENNTNGIDSRSQTASELDKENEYLVPMAPLSALNLFDGLSHDVVFGSSQRTDQEHQKIPTLSSAKVFPQSFSSAGTASTSNPKVFPAELIHMPWLSNKISIPIFPCISLRHRKTSMGNIGDIGGIDVSGGGNSEISGMLMNLNIDVTAHANVDVILRSVEVSIPTGGKVERLLFASGTYPLRLHPLDGVTEVFWLFPLSLLAAGGAGGTGGNRNSGILTETAKPEFVRTVAIKVDFTPVIHTQFADEDDNSLGPSITTIWNTSIDFSPASASASGPASDRLSLPAPIQPSEQNLSVSGFRSISGQSSSAWLQMQQLRTPGGRSPSGSFMGGESGAISPGLGSSLWTMPTAPPAVHLGADTMNAPIDTSNHLHVPNTQQIQLQQQQQIAAALREIVHEGLSLTFTGPTEVTVGQEFSWKVYISNKSRTSKRIALLVEPKRWKPNNLKPLPRDFPGPGLQSVDNAVSKLDADSLIMDYEALYSVHSSGIVKTDELVSLVNDIRIGPLGPGAVHESEIRLIALSVGVLSLDGVRVVDLIKGEGFDCTNLMNVISRR